MKRHCLLLAVAVLACLVAPARAGRETWEILDQVVPLPGQAQDDAFRVRLTSAAVSLSVTLPANQSVNVNQWGGAATTLGQKAGTASIPVVLASDQVVVSSEPATSSAPTTDASVTVVSAQIISANANRRGIECNTPNTNTDELFLSLDGAASTSDIPVSVGASWQPPPGVRFTGSVNAVSNSGTQSVRCTEY